MLQVRQLDIWKCVQIKQPGEVKSTHPAGYRSKWCRILFLILRQLQTHFQPPNQDVPFGKIIGPKGRFHAYQHQSSGGGERGPFFEKIFKYTTPDSMWPLLFRRHRRPTHAHTHIHPSSRQLIYTLTGPPNDDYDRGIVALTACFRLLQFSIKMQMNCQRGLGGPKHCACLAGVCSVHLWASYLPIYYARCVRGVQSSEKSNMRTPCDGPRSLPRGNGVMVVWVESESEILENVMLIWKENNLEEWKIYSSQALESRI